MQVPMVRREPDGTIHFTRMYDPDTAEERLLRSIFGATELEWPIPDPSYCWICGAGPNVYCDHDPRPTEGSISGEREQDERKEHFDRSLARPLRRPRPTRLADQRRRVQTAF